MSATALAEAVLWYALLPLWIATGLLDWLCHRLTRIEHTSGLPENAMHWVLMGEGGVALLGAALLEPNAGLLLLVAAAWLAHEVTTFLELRYTVHLRAVRPSEQMVHSFMEVLPLALLGLLAVLGWEQAAAVFGPGMPDFRLRLRAHPWPAGHLAGAAVGVLLFNILPLAEETWRCIRRK